MEQKVEVKPYDVKYVCDACNNGEIKPTGEMKLSDPPKFVHKCDQCGKTIDLLENYPLIRYGVEE